MVGRFRGRLVPVALICIVMSIAYTLISTTGYPQYLDEALRTSTSLNNHTYQDYEILQTLNLTPAFEYRRRCIIAKPVRGNIRQPLTDLPWALLPEAIRLESRSLGQSADLRLGLPPCEQDFQLQVPLQFHDSKIDTNQLMLGVATFSTRANESFSEMARWLSNTGTQLLVHLRDHPEDAMIRSLCDKAEALHLKVTILPFQSSAEGEAQSNFALAAALNSHRKPETRWYGIIDDDTFFVSLPKLLAALSPFDPDLPWYIGALTERHLGLSTEGFKAWGGAGIFLSPPLLEILAAHSEECMSLSGTWGDALWRDCLMQVTSPTVRLTQLPGLHQLDMFDDVAGWYESGPDHLLSLHHWKSWHFFPVPLAHLVTDVAGVDTFLQRYKFADGAVLTNGFSVARYPKSLPDFGLVEGTMHPYPGSRMPENGNEFFDSLGALRPALREGTDKISWRLSYGVKTTAGCVRQFYVKRAALQVDKSQVDETPIDSVIEIDWCRH